MENGLNDCQFCGDKVKMIKEQEIQEIQKQIEGSLEYFSKEIVIQRISENVYVSDDKAEKMYDILNGLYSLICKIGNLERQNRRADDGV